MASGTLKRSFFQIKVQLSSDFTVSMSALRVLRRFWHTGKVRTVAVSLNIGKKCGFRKYIAVS